MHTSVTVTYRLGRHVTARVTVTVRLGRRVTVSVTVTFRLGLPVRGNDDTENPHDENSDNKDDPNAF